MPRPIPTFYGFAGQTDTVDAIRAHVKGVRAANRSLPHSLFEGSSGLGKTELANATAQAMGTQFLPFYASDGTKRYQLARHLAKVNKADIVFIDEVHALRDSVQELLYPAIDDHLVLKVGEDDRILENEFVEIPEFTLIVATDQPGKLKNALRQRLTMRFMLSPYPLEDMRVIVSNRAADLSLLLSPQAITRVAEAARGVPRRARHLLQSVRDCHGDAQAELSKPDVEKTLSMLGIDADNLTVAERKYLGILGRRGGFVSLGTLALQMGLDARSIQNDIEVELVSRELIGIGGRGRHLTASGKDYVEQKGL